MTNENTTPETETVAEVADATSVADVTVETPVETEAPAEEKVAEEIGESEDDKPEMSWPVPVYPLVARFDVQPVDLEDQQRAIVVAIYTGAGAAFGLLSREGALALSSRLRKIANGGK